MIVSYLGLSTSPIPYLRKHSGQCPHNFSWNSLATTSDTIVIIAIKVEDSCRIEIVQKSSRSFNKGSPDIYFIMSLFDAIGSTGGKPFELVLYEFWSPEFSYKLGTTLTSFILMVLVWLILTKRPTSERLIKQVSQMEVSSCDLFCLQHMRNMSRKSCTEKYHFTRIPAGLTNQLSRLQETRIRSVLIVFQCQIYSLRMCDLSRGRDCRYWSMLLSPLCQLACISFFLLLSTSFFFSIYASQAKAKDEASKPSFNVVKTEFATTFISYFHAIVTSYGATQFFYKCYVLDLKWDGSGEIPEFYRVFEFYVAFSVAYFIGDLLITTVLLDTYCQL